MIEIFATPDGVTLSCGQARSTSEAPTLVVAGDEHMIAGPARAEAILRELRDGRLVTIPDSGRFAEFLL